jgi:hypothetical protein
VDGGVGVSCKETVAVTGAVADPVSLSERGVEPQAMSHETPITQAKLARSKGSVDGGEMIR